MSKERTYFLLLILGTGFWGISFSVVKIGIGEGSPFVFLAYKFGVAAAVLAALFFRRIKHLTTDALVAGILIGLPLLLGNVFQTIGLQKTSVMNTAFISALDVLVIPLIKWGLFRQSVQKKLLAASLIALWGLYMILVRDVFRLNAGDIWVMGCTLFFACYVLTVGFFANRQDPLVTIIVALGFSGIGCALIATLDGPAVWVPKLGHFWTGIAFSALFATAFMYAVQSAAQRYLPEEKVALTFLCEPVFATLFGVLLLGETLSLRVAVGGAMILFSMVLSEVDFARLRQRQKEI